MFLGRVTQLHAHWGLSRDILVAGCSYIFYRSSTNHSNLKYWLSMKVCLLDTTKRIVVCCKKASEGNEVRKLRRSHREGGKNKNNWLIDLKCCLLSSTRFDHYYYKTFYVQWGTAPLYLSACCSQKCILILIFAISAFNYFLAFTAFSTLKILLAGDSLHFWVKASIANHSRVMEDFWSKGGESPFTLGK